MVAVERLVAGCGYAMALHESLGKIFRPFEHSTRLRRADDSHMTGAGIGFQLVADTFHQRVFRSHHYHVNVFSGHEVLHRLKVGSIERHILAHFGRAGIARRHKKFLNSLTLSYLPCQGVLTAAAAQE